MSFDGTNVFATTANNDNSGACCAGADPSNPACSLPDQPPPTSLSETEPRSCTYPQAESNRSEHASRAAQPCLGYKVLATRRTNDCGRRCLGAYVIATEHRYGKRSLLLLILMRVERRAAGNTGADNYAEATLKLELQGNTIAVIDFFRPADYATLDKCDAGRALTPMLTSECRLGLGGTPSAARR